MAKVQKYELIVVFDSQGDESEIRREFDVVQSILENRAENFLGRAEWGYKEFKFPIKKRTSGHYVYYLFKAEPDFPVQLGHALKMNEKVLRHILVRANANSEEYLNKLDQAAPIAETIAPVEEPPTELLEEPVEELLEEPTEEQIDVEAQDLEETTDISDTEETAVVEDMSIAEETPPTIEEVPVVEEVSAAENASIIEEGSISEEPVEKSAEETSLPEESDDEKMENGGINNDNEEEKEG